ACCAPPRAVEFLRMHAGHDRVLVVRKWQQRFPLSEKMGTLYGLNVGQDYEPLEPAAYHEFLRPLEFSQAAQRLFWGPLSPSPAAAAWKLLDMLAVRYVIVARDAPWTGEDVPDRFRL